MRVLFWTKQAHADLAAISAFISQDSPHYASFVIARLIATTDGWYPFLNPVALFQNSRIP